MRNRLEIDERSAVEAIEADDRQAETVDPDELDHARRDRVGPHRRAQREGAAVGGVVARRLQDEVAARLVHPVEHEQVGAGLDAGECRGIARVDLDGAGRVRLAGVLRAVVPGRPGGADAADEIKPGIEILGQLDRDLAGPDCVGVVDHGWLLGANALAHVPAKWPPVPGWAGLHLQ
jgi:hypothetical protein